APPPLARRRACVPSNQPQRLEARVALSPDDDVIVQPDAQCAGGLDHGLRHLDVGARGARVAGRVVVDENDRGRRYFERPLHYFAWINRRVVDGSDLRPLVRDQLVALVEIEHAKLFFAGEGHGGGEIMEYRRPGRQHRLLPQAAAQQLVGGRLYDFQIRDRLLASPETSARRAGGAEITSANE